MSSFIKPLSNHWRPTDFDLSNAHLKRTVLHITKTICLLEFRCDDYADYLRAIFRERDPAWNAAVDQWNAEECQHGVVLRKLSEAGDHQFLFPRMMTAYESLVSYHAPTGQSVRGSVGAELVSRCVVEALASTLYRVLAESTDDPASQAVFSALAQDEARHFGMFLKMLDAEATITRPLGCRRRVIYAIRRMLELEDGQIMIASAIVAGRSDGISRQREANSYLRQLYKLYRWKHLRYALQMLLRTVNVRRSTALVEAGTAILWFGVKLRWSLAVLCDLVAPPKKSRHLEGGLQTRLSDPSA